MIVIPMAGLSRRFFEAGYEVPKYMLPAKGQSLFYHSVASFRNYFESEHFVFAYRDVYGTGDFIKAELEKLGVSPDRVTLVDIAHETRGQADTVALAIQGSGLDAAAQQDLTIFNIDTIRANYTRPLEVVRGPAEGYIEVLRAPGEHWSFVDGPFYSWSAGIAETIREKERISDLCSTGLYWFRTVGGFLEAFEKEAARPPSEWPKGELYVAPLYQQLVDAGRRIDFHVIGESDVAFSGTPDEFERFANRPPTGRQTALCVSGQVRGEDGLRAVKDLAEVLDADVFLSTWRQSGAKSLSGITIGRQLDRVLGRELNRLLPSIIRAKADETFPALNTEILAASSFDVGPVTADILPNAVVDAEDPILDLSLQAVDANSLRMLYKIWRCSRLRREAERKRGERYARIVRLRPDVRVDAQTLNAIAVKPQTVAAALVPDGGLNDTFWVTDSETDDLIVSAFAHTVNMSRRWNGIHSELRNHVDALGIKIVPLNGRSIALPGGYEGVSVFGEQMIDDLVSGRVNEKFMTKEVAHLVGRVLQSFYASRSKPAEHLEFICSIDIGQVTPQVIETAVMSWLMSGRYPDTPATAQILAVWCNLAALQRLDFANRWSLCLSFLPERPKAILSSLEGYCPTVIVQELAKDDPVLAWFHSAILQVFDEAKYQSVVEDVRDRILSTADLAALRVKRFCQTGRFDEARRDTLANAELSEQDRKDLLAMIDKSFEDASQ